MSNSEDDKKTRRRGLGKGLGALIPASNAKPAAATADEKGPYITLAVSKIHPAPDQPRKAFDDDRIEELSRSIAQSGLIQPLVVREVSDGYELIAGERRWRACQRAGIAEVPVVVKDIDDDQAFVLALVENIQREDLNPVEEALAFKRLLNDFEHTQQAVAERVGKSRSAVANSLRLLNLSPKILAFLASGDLSAGHARSLVTLPTEEAEELAELMVKYGYTVREAEEMVRQQKAESEQGEVEKPKPTSRFRDDAHVRDIANRLQSALGTKVKLKDRDGKGRIEIHYEDYDILQSVLERLIDAELG